MNINAYFVTKGTCYTYCCHFFLHTRHLFPTFLICLLCGLPYFLLFIFLILGGTFCQKFNLCCGMILPTIELW